MAMNSLTVLNDSFGRPAALHQDWGFSALIEYEGRRILFDTGNSARTFAHNVDALGIDLRSLDCAVISHRHGDHTSGLNHLLTVHPQLTVYTPEETYGVFGSSLPGSFFPSCHTLPNYMRYYEGKPPDVIRHGSPWPDANFVWTRATTEISPGVMLVPVVSDIPGTRELREITLVLRTGCGLVLVAGCSHPGIENILQAVAALGDSPIDCIFGGLHLVLTEPTEVTRIANALRLHWRVQRIAPGHCTGEPAFAALLKAFGDDYVFAGLGETVGFGSRTP
jgi:7,8-dihydropterin-6-yl-methyl-4-(beta-D-ribofuranosyl)aminobenzene 5'-phosphate synthase